MTRRVTSESEHWPDGGQRRGKRHREKEMAGKEKQGKKKAGPSVPEVELLP